MLHPSLVPSDMTPGLCPHCGAQLGPDRLWTIVNGRAECARRCDPNALPLPTPYPVTQEDTDRIHRDLHASSVTVRCWGFTYNHGACPCA